MKVLAAVLVAALVPAQVAADGWARVEQLTAGTRILVTYLDGHSEERVVEGTGQTQLMLRTGKRPATNEMVARDRILEIALERRRRNPAGAIIGAVGGFVWGLAFSGLQCKTAGCALGFGAVDAAIGALIGHSVSRTHVTFDVIYRANHLTPDPI